MAEKESKKEKKACKKNVCEKENTAEKQEQTVQSDCNCEKPADTDTGELLSITKAELEQLKGEVEKQKDLYLRTAAEYANYRTRTDKEKLEIYTNASCDAIKNILPIADSIELAIKSSEAADDEFKKGLKLIKSQLDKAFEILSVESFGEVHDSFDPAIHNAIARIEDESFSENEISMVFQKGYRCKDKIIRYCMVQVANG